MAGMAVMMMAGSCTSHYSVTSIERTRMLVDRTYDVPASNEVKALMGMFSPKVDSLMSPIIGEAAMPLEPYRPESPMGNLLPDVMVWSAKFYNEKPDFGVYNIGGMRAALAKGKVTIGDVYEVAPFENKVCFVTLTGEKVLELMQQIVGRGGEGVSREVRIVATKDRRLKSVTINGKQVDPNGKYRIATVDYVSHGNDQLVAFKSSTDSFYPTEEAALTREVLMRFFKEKAAKGESVSCNIEGRIIMEE